MQRRRNRKSPKKAVDVTAGAITRSTSAAIFREIFAEDLPLRQLITMLLDSFAFLTTVWGFFPLQATTHAKGEDWLEIEDCVCPP